MCGIFGVLHFATGAVDVAASTTALRILGHRGPDSIGHYADESVFLGATRLSIVGAHAAKQPYYARGKDVVVLFNGEIYNHRELARDLLGRSASETEGWSDGDVLAHLYDKLGERFVEHLNGMFAIAIWDRRQRTLRLYRDRAGMKPLFLAQNDRFLAFASEAKALFASGLVPFELDSVAVSDLLHFTYPLPPRSLFKNVRELEPAHALSLDARTRDVRSWRYWQLPLVRGGRHTKRSYADATAEFGEVLTEAVRSHLPPRGEWANLLSGGIDSTVVSLISAHEKRSGPIRTFSVGFADQNVDESALAAEMAGELGAEHTAVRCSAPGPEEFLSSLWHTELPLFAPISIPFMKLAGSIHDAGLKVALSGEGADEILGGYDGFKQRKLGRLLGSPVLRGVQPLAFRSLYRWAKMERDAIEFLIESQRSSRVASARYGHFPIWHELWELLGRERDGVYPQSSRVDEEVERLKQAVDLDYTDVAPLDAAVHFELHTRLPSWILRVGDRSFMAKSVETRMPFLDHRVIELAMRLPPHYKLRAMREKAILRDAFAKKLPRRVARRPKKPFYTPIFDWFFKTPNRDVVAELLDPRALASSGFDSAATARLVRELEVLPRTSLRSRQVEWVLLLVLGVQGLKHEFGRRLGSPQPSGALAA